MPVYTKELTHSKRIIVMAPIPASNDLLTGKVN